MAKKKIVGNWLQLGQGYLDLRAVGELKKINQSLEQLSGQLTASLYIIHEQLEEANELASASLEVQQEMLNRDTAQAQLEEFSYQLSKIVEDYQKPDIDIPMTAVFFILSEMLDQIEEHNITTALIRGRSEKEAFTDAVNQAAKQVQELEQNQEVIDAIEWIQKEEKKRLISEGLQFHYCETCTDETPHGMRITPVNHFLHFIVSIFTVGLWFPMMGTNWHAIR